MKTWEQQKSGERIPLEAIRKLAAEGKTAQQISEILHCSRGRVSAKARENGIRITHATSFRGGERDTSAVSKPEPPRPPVDLIKGTFAWYAAQENKAMRDGWQA